MMRRVSSKSTTTHNVSFICAGKQISGQLRVTERPNRDPLYVLAYPCPGRENIYFTAYKAYSNHEHELYAGEVKLEYSPTNTTDRP